MKNVIYFFILALYATSVSAGMFGISIPNFQPPTFTTPSFPTQTPSTPVATPSTPAPAQKAPMLDSSNLNKLPAKNAMYMNVEATTNDISNSDVSQIKDCTPQNSRDCKDARNPSGMHQCEQLCKVTRQPVLPQPSPAYLTGTVFTDPVCPPSYAAVYVYQMGDEYQSQPEITIPLVVTIGDLNAYKSQKGFTCSTKDTYTSSQGAWNAPLPYNNYTEIGTPLPNVQPAVVFIDQNYCPSDPSQAGCMSNYRNMSAPQPFTTVGHTFTCHRDAGIALTGNKVPTGLVCSGYFQNWKTAPNPNAPQTLHTNMP